MKTELTQSFRGGPTNPARRTVAVALRRIVKASQVRPDSREIVGFNPYQQIRKTKG